MSKQSGFTLLEVMLAILVLSLGLTAMIYAGQLTASTTERLEKTATAYFLANQLMLELYKRPGVNSGYLKGKKYFLDDDWYWQAAIKNTDNKNIIRIDLKVSLDKKIDFSLAQLTGFKNT